MRRSLANLLVFVMVDVSLVVDRQELIGIDSNKNGTSVGLQSSEVGRKEGEETETERERERCEHTVSYSGKTNLRR